MLRGHGCIIDTGYNIAAQPYCNSWQLMVFPFSSTQKRLSHMWHLIKCSVTCTVYVWMSNRLCFVYMGSTLSTRFYNTSITEAYKHTTYQITWFSIRVTVNLEFLIRMIRRNIVQKVEVSPCLLRTNGRRTWSLSKEKAKFSPASSKFHTFPSKTVGYKTNPLIHFNQSRPYSSFIAKVQSDIIWQHKCIVQSIFRRDFLACVSSFHQTTAINA